VNYKIGDGTVEFAIPFSPAKKLLSDGPHGTDFWVANADAATRFIDWVPTGVCTVDYSDQPGEPGGQPAPPPLQRQR
jgi:hypothetical protein